MDTYISDIDKTIKLIRHACVISIPNCTNVDCCIISDFCYFQAPQLSPLSGAYCLIVVGEPFSDEHKKLILQKLQQGKKRTFFFHLGSHRISNPLSFDHR